jgi:hypothetical protein
MHTKHARIFLVLMHQTSDSTICGIEEKDMRMPVLLRSDHTELCLKSSGDLCASPTGDVSSDKVMEWVTKSGRPSISVRLHF